MFSNGLLQMGTLVWANQQKLTFISSVCILDATKKTYQKQWPIGTEGENESKESVLLIHLNDNDKLHCCCGEGIVFFTPVMIGGFCWRSRDNKYHVYSRTLLRILILVGFSGLFPEFWTWLTLVIFMFYNFFSSLTCWDIHQAFLFLLVIQGAFNKFPDFFFVWALLLIEHTWNSSPLPNNLLQLQCTCTVPTTSGRPHGSPLVWACHWPLSQPLSSPQLSHNNSL